MPMTETRPSVWVAGNDSGFSRLNEAAVSLSSQALAPTQGIMRLMRPSPAKRAACNALGKERRLAPIVTAAVMLAAGSGPFEADTVLGNKIHERRCRVGDDGVGVFAVRIVDPSGAERPDDLYPGVNASDVETMRHRSGVAVSAT
jgi:hypothetical protein